MAERQGDGRATNRGGVYRHKQTGQEIIAIETEKFGNPQGDAFVRLGFEYVGPVTSREDKEAVEAIPDPNATPAVTQVETKTKEVEAKKTKGTK